MKITSLSKPLIITIFTLALLSYGFIVVNAAYPLTQWEPGETLDPGFGNPGCTPGSANCSVATAWDMDLTDGTVFNLNDTIGIGADPAALVGIDPGIALGIEGSVFFNSDYAVGETITMITGDLVDGFAILHRDDNNPLTPSNTSFSLRREGINLGVKDTTDSQQGISLSVTSDATGGRSGLSLVNDLDSAPSYGMYGVMEAKEDADIAKRYGFSFWASPNKYSADHYEFDPQSGLDTKGRFVTDTEISDMYIIESSIQDSTNAAPGSPYAGLINDYSFHRSLITDTGYQWDYNTQTNVWNPETRMTLGTDFELLASNTSRFLVDMATGDTTIAGTLNQLSDQRLKTNIQNLTLGLDTINQLRPVDYTMISSDAYQIGFVAQEMQNVIPALVNDSREYLSVNYIGMIPVLTKAVQEISAKIDILEQQTISNGGFSLASLRNTVQDFLGDVGNGIQTIFTNKIVTNELCVEDVCVSRDEFLNMVQSFNAEQVVQEEIIEEEVIIPEVIEQDQIEQEVEPTEETEEVALELEDQEQVIVEPEPEPQPQEEVSIE